MVEDRRAGDDERRPTGSPAKRFLTGLPGVLTGIATVITAGATIFGVLLPHHDSDHGSQETAPPPRTAPTAPDDTGTSAVPAASTPSGAQGGFTRQWGPSELAVTNDGTDLSLPPVSRGGDEPDLYEEGNGFGQMNSTRLAVWHGGSTPTAQQCQDLVTTGSTGLSVDVTVGTVVCARTQDGNVAILQVRSVDSSTISATTLTSIWTAS